MGKDTVLAYPQWKGKLPVIQQRVQCSSETQSKYHGGSNEIDTHADNLSLGKNFLPLYYTG